MLPEQLTGESEDYVGLQTLLRDLADPHTPEERSNNLNLNKIESYLSVEWSKILRPYLSIG